jgi:hypothetical protein
VVNNLYLGSVDEALSAIPGLFYSRFGDDLMLVHEAPPALRQASDALSRGCEALGLTLNPEKTKTLYLTVPGRSSAQWPEATPASFVTYLGARLSLNGNLGLADDKARRVLRELRRRVTNTNAFVKASPLEARMSALVTVVRDALDPSSGVEDPKAAPLRGVVDDRGQLKQLDYLVALSVAEALSGLRGPRAFRKVSYRRLRQAGLPSLVDHRNRAVRKQRWTA